jgi:hypothetical protein
MERMAREESPVIESIRRECEAAVREDGAAAIALGCTCMAPIGPTLAALLPVPVYESSRTALRAAIEFALASRPRSHGTSSVGARAGDGSRARDPRLIPRLVEAGLAGLAPASGPDEPAGPACEAECAPCAVLSLESGR